MNSNLQNDDCEADAITTAYLKINMVEVARSRVGYPSWRRPTGILQPLSNAIVC